MPKINPKKLSQVKSAVLLRWSLIFLVGASLIALGRPWYLAAIVSLVAVVANLLFDAPRNSAYKSLNNKWLIMTLSFVYCVSVLQLTGGELSPYFAMIFLLVVFSSYLYSYHGALYACLLSNIYLLYIYSQNMIDFRDINIMLGLAVTGFLIARINQEKIDQVRQAHRAGKQILQDDQQLSSVVNTIADAVVLVDKNNHILRYNGAALELIDTHEEILGKKLTGIISFLDKDGKQVKPTELAIGHNKFYISDDLSIKRGDKTIQLYVTASPIKRGALSAGAVLLARDISAQKTLEMQKDEFLSIISHELRTPVAIVEADLSTALLPSFARLPAKANKLLRNAYNNLNYLSTLLQDLSSLTQADRSVIETEIKQIEVKNLVQDLSADLADKASKAGLKIKTKISAKLPQITNSEGRIREILVNYLTNAIKYGGGGKQIIFSAIPSESIIGGVEFSVIDFGIGIKPEDQTKLFGKFYRTDEVKQKNIQGTGMGLYITKKQAEKLGGRVWFKSQSGKGSAFYLEVASAIKH